MAIQMYKGKVSEIVGNRDVQQRLKDGWTFTPSKKTTKSVKNKIKAEAEVTTTDLSGPEDLNQEVTTNGN